MKEAIRQHAVELGFDDCRFTKAEPPASARYFQNWLKSHQHGGMAYLERTAVRRVDPQLVLPSARSVICLAASYAGDSEPSTSLRRQTAMTSAHPSPGLKATLSPSDGEREGASGGTRKSPENSHTARLTHRGLVARYACFDDYHEVLGERLNGLTDFVNQLAGDGTRSLWHVDTGPVLERDLAQRAGIGFIGKHTNVISRKMGNWIFLAEILTTIELAPDAPEKNRCGTCACCINACPTRAISMPFQLDARRCISYLTIELKGSIPVELRPYIGNRVFGCDDCLAVCPWNRFAREGQLMKAHAKPQFANPDLLELLTLDDAEFKRRFAGMPMLRAKRTGLVRNACVALGNVGDQSALPALQRIASAPDAMLAEHARWAIDRIREP